MIGLVLSICISMSGGVEDCDSRQYVVDTFTGKNAIEDCMKAMEENPQTRPDRYLSCQHIDGRYLKRRSNETPREILSRLETDE